MDGWLDRVRGPVDETRAWTCLGVNLAVLPGMGSAMAGRLASGIPQAVLALTGAGLSTWWLVLLLREWSRQGDFPIDGGVDLRIGVAGVTLFAAAWLWSLATSLAVIREVRTTGTNGRHGGTETRKT